MEHVNMGVLLLGIVIFFARIIDVSISTIRTISIVHGRTKIAFFLGLIEVSMWLVVLTTVIDQIRQQPLLAVFYALGFSTGNVVGIHLERRIALGQIILRVITPRGGMIAERLWDAGYAVTTFDGEGRSGPVVELYAVCKRKDLDCMLDIVKSIEPDAFYTTVPAGNVSKIYRPMMDRPGIWGTLKKK
jgi:uncharacterized protein YebE (UPF0316 family)